MAERLRELGFEIDPAPIDARKAAGKPVGRPHLAAAVIAHPANAERLEEEGLGEVSSFIPAYLIQGKPGYVARTHPTVEEAIGWIHDAAGVAVWAHPFWDIEDPDQVLAAIDRYRAAGLDGVEAFYTAHDRDQTVLLADRCAELGLLTTGSSDYHGPEHKLFSRFRAFLLHGREPNLGPIAAGTLAAPTRDGNGLCLWLTGLSGSGKSTIARWPRAGCATWVTAWRCSTATTCARTSAPVWVSRARTAPRTCAGSPSSRISSRATACSPSWLRSRRSAGRADARGRMGPASPRSTSALRWSASAGT